jgi:hypothetical protein
MTLVLNLNPNKGWEGQKKPHNLQWLNTQKSNKGQKADIQAMPSSVHYN